MKRSLLVLTCLTAIAAAMAGANDAEAARSRDLNKSFALADGQSVRLDFPVGQLRVEATSGDRVIVELTARCKWRDNCDDALEDIHIHERRTDRRLEVDVDAPRPWGKLKLELKATIKVPRDASLTVDMGIGELRVSGFRNDQWIDLGIGEVSVEVPESVVRSLSVDAGIGDASLHGSDHAVSGRRSKLIGSEVSWDEGEGDSRISVEVGIGEASVWMD